MADDLTYGELKRKLKVLEESERVYRTIVDNSPDLLYRTDLQGRITYISRSVYDLSGYTNDEALGMKMAEEVYLIPEERNLFLETLQKQGKVSNFEARLKRKDGTIWWASTNAHFLEDDDGAIIGVEGITRDISALKSTEQALKESEHKFRAIFEQAAVGVALTSSQTGEMLQVNRKYCDIVGYTTGAMHSIKFQDAMHPDDMPTMRQMANQLIAGKIRDFSMEIRFIRSDGSVVWANLNVSPMWSAGEQPTMHIAVIEDITDRKLMEAQVKTLSGLLPICASCKKIRDDSGYWKQIESFIAEHSDADFSHGLCPSCMDAIYGDQEWYRKSRRGK